MNDTNSEALRRIERASMGGEVELDLERCALREIPYEVRECSRLRVLLVAHNELSFVSSIPSHVEYLDASYNKIRSVCRAPRSLRQLHLAHNRLASLPPLRHVRVLDVSYNNLLHISSLSSATQLLTLHVAHNELSSIPSTTAPLEEIDASHNRIHTLDFPSTSFPALRYLDLAHNPITTIHRITASLQHLCIDRLSADYRYVLPRELRTVTVSNDTQWSRPPIDPSMRYAHDSINDGSWRRFYEQVERCALAAELQKN